MRLNRQKITNKNYLLYFIYIMLAINMGTGTVIEANTHENPIEEITWVTDEWPEFTQKDGQGVYHEFIQAVFSNQGVKINVIYASWSRSVEGVEEGIYDMTGGLTENDGYYQSQYPVYEYDDLIVFKKNKMKCDGVESLMGKKGSWVRGYKRDYLDRLKKSASCIEVSTHKNGLMFIGADRADYFLTEKKALQNYSKQIEKMDMSKYEVVNIKTGQLYFSFPKNERGKKIRDMYDRGVESLDRETISRIYKKWGVNVPSYDLQKEIVFYTGVQSPIKEILEKILREAFQRIDKKVKMVFTGSSQRALLMANEQGDGDAIRISNVKEIAPEITNNLLIIPESILDSSFHVYTKGNFFPVTGFDALQNYRNGFRIGIKFLEKNMPGEKIMLPDTDRLFQMLNQGRLDTVIEHSLIGDFIINNQDFKNIVKLSPSLICVDSYSFIHKKHQALIPAIAKALSNMKTDGSLEKIKTDVMDKKSRRTEEK